MASPEQPGAAADAQTFDGLDVKEKVRNVMVQSERKQNQIGKGLVVIASVLLVSIIVLGAGYFSGHRITFYAGLFVTLAGVLTGIQQLVAHNHSWRSGR